MLASIHTFTNTLTFRHALAHINMRGHELLHTCTHTPVLFTYGTYSSQDKVYYISNKKITQLFAI